MAINIKSPQTELLVRKLVDLTGESITEAIQRAVEDRLTREETLRRQQTEKGWERIGRIRERIARYPEVDLRSADEILGYDEHGLPT